MSKLIDLIKLHRLDSTNKTENLSNIEKLLQDSPEMVNEPNERGYLPLSEAIYETNEDIVKILLDHGADITLKDRYGNNALHSAVHYDYKGAEIAELLIESSADKKNLIRARNEYGMEALHIAVSKANLVSVKFLLSKDAKNIVNSPTSDGNTALHLAALHLAALEGKLDIVRLLLENGAKYSVNSTNLDGNTPLHIAAYYGDKGAEITELLIENSPNKLDLIRAKNGQGMTALHIASINKAESIVKLLVSKRKEALINWRNRYGDNVLHVAALRGKLDSVKSLLEWGTETLINLRNSSGDTPLHCAAYHGDKGAEIAELLVKNSLDEKSLISAGNKDGMTALHIAVVKANPILVKFLLGKDAKNIVNSPNSSGNTPLHLAALLQVRVNMQLRTQRQIIELLLEHGAIASINWSNSGGNTTLHIAAYHSDKGAEIAKLLIENSTNKLDLIYAKNVQGDTPLHFAVYKGNIDIVELLSKSTENTINAQNSNGDTPLHMASIHDQFEITEVLLKQGANRDIKNKDGHTMLDILASKEYERMEESCKSRQTNLNPVQTVTDAANLFSPEIGENSSNENNAKTQRI